MQIRSMKLWFGVLSLAAAAGLSAQFISRLQAQALLAPSFTAAQVTAGQQTYAQNCASCHGANLDDGEFGPPVKSPEFRQAWFGRSADVLFEKVEAMPPARPGSLGDQRYAEVMAYLLQQNQLAAGDKPLQIGRAHV